MAELHRRILGLPHRGRRRLAALRADAARPRAASAPARIAAVVVALTLAWVASPARADEAPPASGPPSAAALSALAKDLRAESEGARAAAFEALSSLPDSALPAIEERFREMRKEPVRGEDGYEILRAFAHAVGSSSASDPVDVAPGVAPVLREGRSLARARMAERLALLRSLEHIGTARAMVAMLELFEHDFEAFRWEARHIVQRVGRAAGAALLRGAASGGSLRVWGRWGQRALGIDDPTRMIADQDEASVVEIVRAYGELRHMGGMPVVADFVDDPREPVRRAAREAMEDYGQNGIWQLRRVMEQQLGQPPDLDASWRATMRALYAGLDARRLAPLNERLDDALAAAAAGRPDEAVSALDALLARAPELPRRGEGAPLYAAVGDARLESGRWDEARRAYDRALWLDGSHPKAPEWRASRALAEAELGIERGAPEAALLEAALASPVARERAEARLDGDEAPVMGAEGARDPELVRRPSPSALAFVGALLLVAPWLSRGSRRLTPALWAAAASARELATRSVRLSSSAANEVLRIARVALRRPVAQLSPPLASGRKQTRAVLPPEVLFGAAPAPSRSKESLRAPRDAALEPRAAAEPRSPSEPRAPVEPRSPSEPRAAAEPRSPSEPRAAAEPRSPSEPRAAAEPRAASNSAEASAPPRAEPTRQKRSKRGPAVLPADLVFATPPSRGRLPTPRRAASTAPPTEALPPEAATTSPGTVSAIDTLPG